MIPISYRDAELIKHTLFRAILEIILTLLLLIFHGTWTWMLILALVVTVLWGSIERHADDY